MQMENLLLRSTFIVNDIEAAISFYTTVFDWRVVYDTTLAVDNRYPPAAPNGAACRLVLIQAADPEIGGIGFMRYLEHQIPAGPDKTRKALRQGEAILVIKSSDPDAIYERVKRTAAVVIAPPADWTVPGPKPGQIIRLRTMSLFDPNGIYMEVNLKYPD